ncbi:MAG: discoidin domain-containing protein [Planctomycetota bacterium]
MSIAQSLGDPGRGIHNQRWRSGVPLGGLGCGKLELLTDGAFGNFTINHNWDRPTGLVRGTFFALRAAGHTTLLRLKRPGEYPHVAAAERRDGMQFGNVAEVAYQGLFPRALLRFGGLGLTLELDACAPLIPYNVDDSALPVAFFTFRLCAPRATSVALLCSWENLLGWGGRRQIAWEDRSGNTHAPVQIAPAADAVPQPVAPETGAVPVATGTSAVPAPGTAAVPGGTATWTGLRFTTSPGKPANVTGEYLVLSDGVTTPEPHWDPLAGLLAREVVLPAGEVQTIRFAVLWFLPRHVVAFEKRRKVAGSFATVDARAAIAGEAGTKWTTNPPTLAGEHLTLDLGAARILDGLTLVTAWQQGDFTTTLLLECSEDGADWKFVRHTREPVRDGTAEFTFPQRSARYWRITQTGYGPDWRWEVCRAVGRLGPETIPFVSATAAVHKETHVRSEEDLGHWYLRRHPTADALACYAVSNLERLDQATRDWQEHVLRASLPDWLKLKLLNHSFPAFANTILTRDGRFSVLESPVHMDGALGTMDQRQAAHGFWLMHFPELDRAELELFAACQERVEPVADGRIPHFCGNVHQAVGEPMVEYGTTDWPDLACAWVMQVLKHARWTGNRSFVRRMWPQVRRAMSWLAAADRDNDLIPEGGSTYDYEHLPRGGYIFTASVYLGALRAAAELARLVAEDGHYAELFTQVQAKVLERLFDERSGTFIKWRAGPQADEQKIENSFVACLAGDWMMRLTGLPPIFPPEVCESALRETLARHAKSLRPIPPMEVTPDGRVHTQVCFVLQHEPYLGCEAIYLGYRDDGLDVIRRVYEAAWELNWSPWDCSLNYEAPQGRQSWLVSYMTATATWHVLPALAGMTIDLLGGELHFQPTGPYHGPLFFPTFWAWLDCEPGQAALRIIRMIKPGSFTRINGALRRFDIRPEAVLDLSEHAQWGSPKTAPVRFPQAQPHWQPKPWRVHSVLDGEYDVPPIRTVGLMDGDPRTCWTTDRPMQPGDWVAVDFGAARPVRGLRLDHAGAPGEYPRGLRVETSEDGRTWRSAAELTTAQVEHGLQVGTHVLNIEFTATCRHVRLTQLGQAGLARWSIYEFEIIG